MYTITGAEGLMGRELQKHLKVTAFNHRDVEIRDYMSVVELSNAITPDVMVHLAAYTDVVGAESNHQLCYDTNVIGSRNVSGRFRTLYVSTDYVFDGEKGNYNEYDYPNPLNFYGLTKLLGEYEVIANGGKVVRMSFKPRPYKHDRVPIGMYFSGGYVDDMAKELATAVKLYDQLPPITHVGIRRTSAVDLAKQTRVVEEVSRYTLRVPLPRDVSFDLSLWEGIKCRNA